MHITDSSVQSDPGTDTLISFKISELNSKLSAQARAIISRHSPLTLPQWRIIRLLGMRSMSTSADIRKTIGADKSQFSKSLSLLIERGYVVRSSNPVDKRQSLLSLTPLGKEAHEKIHPYLRLRNEYLLDQLTPEQRRILFDVIHVLGKAAEKTDFSLDKHQLNSMHTQ